MLAVVVAVAAVLVALGTSLLKEVEWSPKVKSLIAVVLSFVGGVAIVFAMGGFKDVTDVLATATLVYGSAQLVYAFILKGTALNDRLEDTSVLKKDTVVENDVVEDPVDLEDLPEDEPVGEHEAPAGEDVIDEPVDDVVDEPVDETPEEDQVD